MNHRTTRYTAYGLASLAALLSILVRSWVFPHFSLNHDEAVYLQHASMLLEGQLRMFPPVEDAFRPWFFVDSGAAVYPKYSPIPAVVYAIAKFLSGTYAAALPVIAASIITLTTVLVWETFDRVTGVLAGVIVLFSPLFVVQSGVFLPYALTLALELGFAVCYLRSERRDDLVYAGAAGALIGSAFFARPYTAVLFALPFLLHASLRIVATQGQDSVLKRHGLTAVVGSFGVALALGYNWVMTGDPFLFPYQAFAPLDGVGFGHRELLGYERFYDFELAISSNLIAVRLFATQWIFGGIFGLVLALIGIAQTVRTEWSLPQFQSFQRSHGHVLILGVGISVIVGNVAFWGTLNALGDLSDPDGLATFLGPYYHFDLLLPIAAFGAVGMQTIIGWVRARTDARMSSDRVRWVVLGVSLVGVLLLGAVTVSVGNDAYQRNMATTATYEEAYAPFEGGAPGDGVVFVPRVYGGWLNHPFQELRNAPGFDGSTVYALRETNLFEVVRSYPDRDLYRYVYRNRWSPATGQPVTAAVRPVSVAHGERVVIPIELGVPSAYESVSVELTSGDTQALYAIERNGTAAEFTVELTGEGIRLYGESVNQVTGPDRLSVTDGDIEIRAFLDTGTGAGVTYRLDIPATVEGETVSVVTPYQEVCIDPRACGGAAAAIDAVLPDGFYINTSVDTTGSSA